MADIDGVLDRHWKELKNLPNVLNVAVSTKHKGGKDTGVPSITVYVDKKRPVGDLNKEHVVPEIIEGIVTDVVELVHPTWKAGKTGISELHPSEQRRRLGLTERPIQHIKSQVNKPVSFSFGQMSDTRKYASAIQNQKNCGSCTVFGCTGCAEGKKRVQTNNESDPIKLSETNLFSCSGGTCDNGNTVDNVLMQLLNKGVCLESDEPYVDQDVPCNPSLPIALKLASWRAVTDISEMKSILDIEPMVATMAVHQSFFNYVSGVYHSLPAGDPVVGYHCISLWGHNEPSLFYILRNSWDVKWGEAGYCNIAFGESEIDGQMYQVVVDLTPIPPGPTPNPTPVPPTPPNNGCLTAPFTWLLSPILKLVKGEDKINLNSKALWLNAIAIASLIVTYFINNHMFAQYILWEGLAYSVLNAIALMIQTQKIAKLKAALLTKIAK